MLDKFPVLDSHQPRRLNVTAGPRDKAERRFGERCRRPLREDRMKEKFFPDTKGKSREFKDLVKFIVLKESFCGMSDVEMIELIKFCLREMAKRVLRRKI